MTVGVDSWVTLAQAGTYFSTRAGGSAWAALASDAERESLLVTAFFWILYDGRYALAPETDSAAVRHAQLEAAYFLMGYREEYERRQALSAAGVTSVGTRVWNETIGAVGKPASVTGALAMAGVSSGGGVFVDVE